MQSWCKLCFNEHNRAFYRANKARIIPQMVLKNRARKLGMTPAEYLAKGEPALKCEICGAVAEDSRNGKHRSGSSPIAKAKRLAIDHDHETGQRRGILCGHCNRAIGLAGDDPPRLRRMARYIEKYRGVAVP